MADGLNPQQSVEVHVRPRNRLFADLVARFQPHRVQLEPVAPSPSIRSSRAAPAERNCCSRPAATGSFRPVGLPMAGFSFTIGRKNGIRYVGASRCPVTGNRVVAGIICKRNAGSIFRRRASGSPTRLMKPGLRKSSCSPSQPRARNGRFRRVVDLILNGGAMTARCFTSRPTGR